MRTPFFYIKKNKFKNIISQYMFLSLLSCIAQNEREKIKERQRQGVILAKKVDRYKGRPTEYASDSKDPPKRLVYQTVVKRLKQGDTVAEIAT